MEDTQREPRMNNSRLSGCWCWLGDWVLASSCNRSGVPPTLCRPSLFCCGCCGLAGFRCCSNGNCVHHSNKLVAAHSNFVVCYLFACRSSSGTRSS
jgi:hypothetical protein